MSVLPPHHVSPPEHLNTGDTGEDMSKICFREVSTKVLSYWNFPLRVGWLGKKVDIFIMAGWNNFFLRKRINCPLKSLHQRTHWVRTPNN